MIALIFIDQETRHDSLQDIAHHYFYRPFYFIIAFSLSLTLAVAVLAAEAKQRSRFQTKRHAASVYLHLSGHQQQHRPDYCVFSAFVTSLAFAAGSFVSTCQNVQSTQIFYRALMAYHSALLVPKTLWKPYSAELLPWFVLFGYNILDRPA